MKAIVDYQNTGQIAKTNKAIDMWLKENKLSAKDIGRITVVWLSENACFVYSKGEKDKQRYNVPSCSKNAV